MANARKIELLPASGEQYAVQRVLSSAGESFTHWSILIGWCEKSPGKYEPIIHEGVPVTDDDHLVLAIANRQPNGGSVITWQGSLYQTVVEWERDADRYLKRQELKFRTIIAEENVSHFRKPAISSG